MLAIQQALRRLVHVVHVARSMVTVYKNAEHFFFFGNYRTRKHLSNWLNHPPLTPTPTPTPILEIGAPDLTTIYSKSGNGGIFSNFEKQHLSRVNNQMIFFFFFF